MKALRDFFRSLVSNPKRAEAGVLNPGDFPLTVDGTKLSKPDGRPIAVAKDSATANEIAERLNEDEQRKEEDRWSA